ncbi:MAG: hypothetical protein AMXMBFR83_25020 [Phycisphaerae bacterium]
MTTKGRSSRGLFFLALFALPFLGVGGFTGCLAVRTIVLHRQARQWVEVPATIRRVELKTHSDGDGSTYRVTCTYSYRYAGREYESSRVGLAGGSDNIGSWQRTTYARLSAAHRAGRTVPCYVNPADPTQALLDRDVRLGMLVFHLLFVTVFGGLGAGLLAFCITARRGERRRLRRQTEGAIPEDQPWLADDRWASGRITPTLATKRNWLVAAAVFFNVVWLPVLVYLPADLRNRNYWGLFAMAGPLIGAILALSAIRLVLRHRRFGGSCFEGRPLPGVIGGHLRGELILSGDVAGLDRVEVTLQCRQTVTERHGGESSTSTRTVWEEGMVLTPPPARFGETQVRLPVDFQIPSSCRPTCDSTGDDKVAWKLLVRAPTPGVDLALDFDVPVFRTAESDPAIGERPETQARQMAADAREEAAVVDQEPPPSARIRVERDVRGHTVFTVSSWPGWGVAVFLFCFAAVFSGVAVFAAVGTLRGNWFLAIFAVAFGLFGLGLWCLWLSFLGSYRVTAGPEGIEARRRWGPFVIHRNVPAGQETAFSMKESASSGTTKWYAVYAQPTNGRRIKLAGMIKGPIAARWFIRRLEAAVR